MTKVTKTLTIIAGGLALGVATGMIYKKISKENEKELNANESKIRVDFLYKDND